MLAANVCSNIKAVQGHSVYICTCAMLQVCSLTMSFVLLLLLPLMLLRQIFPLDAFMAGTSSTSSSKPNAVVQHSNLPSKAPRTPSAHMQDLQCIAAMLPPGSRNSSSEELIFQLERVRTKLQATRTHLTQVGRHCSCWALDAICVFGVGQLVGFKNFALQHLRRESLRYDWLPSMFLLHQPDIHSWHSGLNHRYMGASD